MMDLPWWQNPKVLFDGLGFTVIVIIAGLFVRDRVERSSRQKQQSGSHSTNLQAGSDIIINAHQKDREDA